MPVKELKEVKRGRIAEYVDAYPDATFHADKRPWDVPVDVALPCATQNELGGEDAQTLLKNGVKSVCEGANMPTDLEGARAFVNAGILFGPGKAANAGGVAVSGLEQSQNSLRLSWSANEVDARLQGIMHDIHDKCVRHGAEGATVNYVKGANISGFEKVAEAMLAYGIV
jgi:glutamate dehydrogenase (NADP+)